MWAEEIIVLDSGSLDNTISIAKNMGANVFTNTNWKGFGKQRQLAQNYANNDFILMIDADERVTPKLRKSIELTLTKFNNNTIYSFSRRNFFLGQFMRYGGWYPDTVNRLYNKKYHSYNDNLVHESLNVNNSNIIKLKGDLLHITCHNFISFQRKQLYYAEEWAKQNFKLGKNCTYISIFIHTFNSFFKTLLLRTSFLDGKKGFLLAIINAQYTFNKYTELWNLKNNNIK